MNALSITIKRKLMAAAQHVSVGLLSFLFSTAIFANPVLAPNSSQNVGNFTVQQNANTTTINQTSQKAIINWQSFNIGSHETTHFQQPTGGVALNRINPSQGVSQIYGRLTASGQIILVNPAGIFFAPGAYVNVGGLIASTGNISDQDFLNGYYHFTHVDGYNGAIVNQGQIIAANNGLIALIGGAVSNSGLIQANMGHVILASGDAMTVTFEGNNLVSFAVDAGVSSTAKDQNGKPVKTGVSNTGRIIADGGQILISAKDAAGILDNAISMDGIAQARTISSHAGEIIISGDENNGVVDIAGSLDVSGITAGNINITGHHIFLDHSAVLNANGLTGGGNIYIGGGLHGSGALPHANAVVMASGAQLSANAIDIGNGGNIVLWSDNYTNANGSISSKGGANGGNGGTVETSSKNILNVGDLRVNTLAVKGNNGTWLLDPYDITISSSATSGGSFDAGNPDTFTPTATANVADSNINTNLASSNVFITTGGAGSAGSDNGDITIDNTANISWSSGNNLTLSAYRNITNNGSITSTAGGSLSLIANNAGAFAVGSGNGTVTNNGTLTIDGAVKIYYNPSAYTSPQSYTNTGAGAVTAYMYVNNLTDLQNMNTNLSENYALSTNIDATATNGWNSGAGFVPVGNTTSQFTGSFDGMNHSIANLYINNTNENTGLFGVANSGLSIANLNLTNVNISLTVTNGSDKFVGGLVGSTDGTLNINNITVSGSVTGNDTSNNGHARAGGIVGATGTGLGASVSINHVYNSARVTSNGDTGGIAARNFGSIANAINDGDVTGTNGWSVGGIAGWNPGTIATSYNAGAITNQSGGNAGGIVGNNGALISTIVDSYSTGSVTGRGSSTGGFVGYTGAESDIHNSYSSGLVTDLTGYSGGFVGVNSTGAVFSQSFWDTVTSGQSNSFGLNNGSVTGLTGGTFNGSSGANLSQLATYSGAGWNITSTPSTSSSAPSNTWFIFNGGTRPILMMEYSTNVSNAHQLQLMGTTLGSNYTLANNIDLSSALTNTSDVWGTNYNAATGAGFVPIGDNNNNYTNHYSGIFNGQNFAISNLYINNTNPSSSSSAALFTASTNLIENLILNNPVIISVGPGYSAAALVGNAGSLQNITVNGGSVTTTSQMAGAVGGIAGFTTNDLAGFSTGTVVTNLTVNNMTINGSGIYGVGGIIGYATNDTLANLVNNNSSVTGSNSGGGIGGLVGTMFSASLSTSYNSGAVTGDSKVGGVVGTIQSGSTVQNIYNVGTISSNSTTPKIGGVAGNIDAGGSLVNAYNSGLVLAPNVSDNSAGGLLGINNGNVTNSYWDTQTTGQPTVGVGTGSSSGVTGRTTVQLMQMATYSGWDMTATPSGTSTAPNNIWFIFEGATRPILMMENNSNITNAHQLQMMGAALGGSYVVANNIDLINASTNASDVWKISTGFVPIATNNTFTGDFNGQDYTINNLYIHSSADNVGLFANITSSGTFANVRLTNVNIASQSFTNYTGAFAGQVNGTLTINNVSSSGTISGYNKTGGIVGFLGPTIQGGLITGSYSTATLSALNDTGGIAGAAFGSTITKSYFAGSINNGSNATSAGGILGYGAAGATVTDSYNTGNVSSLTYAGGIVGYATGGDTFNDVYSTGVITSGNNLAGALVGSLNGSTLSNSFWDADTSGNTMPVANNNGTVSAVFGGCFTGTCTSSINASYLFGGTTAANLSSLATYTTTLAANGGIAWDMTSTASTTSSAPAHAWFIFEGYTRPLLMAENTSTITNTHQLQMMGAALGGHYTLANNLDFSTVDARDVWGVAFNAYNISNPYAFPSAKGFSPVGTNTTNFSGTFDGQNYTITDLVINTPTTNYVGLFGATSSTASLSNVVIYNPVIYGGGYVGAIVGNNSGTISNSRATSNTGSQSWVGGELQITNIDVRSTSPTGSGYIVGGIAGQNNGTITDTYTHLNLMGGYVGGLVGVNNGTLARVYSTGSAYDGGYNIAGGLVGVNSATGSIIDSFNTGTASAGYYSAYYGGLVAYNAGLIVRSYNLGGVYPGFLNGAVGVFVGYNAATGNIRDSYTGGYIAFGQGQDGPFGGFVGTNDGVISNSYSYATTYYGTGNQSNGFVGSNNGTINHSYWDIGTSGDAFGYGVNNGTLNGLYGGCFNSTSCNGATPITNATNAGGTAVDMSQSSTFSNFNLTSVWNVIDGQSYPYLRAFYTTTPRAISGYAPSNTQFNSVALAFNGAIQETTLTHHNGFAYFLEGYNNVSKIDRSIADGTGIVAFTTSGGASNFATYAPINGASISGVNGMILTLNTLTATSSETNPINVTPLSNSQIISATGGLSSPYLFFSGSGGDLYMNNGYSFATSAATIYDLSGTLSVTNANININGAMQVSALSGTMISNASGDIVINNTVNGLGNALTINTVGANSSVNGVMSNLSSFTKSGSGSLTLSAANTYTGSTTVNGGILSISSDANLGAVPGGAVANHIQLGGGAILQTTTGLTLNANRGMTMIAGGGTLRSNAGTFSYGGLIDGANSLSLDGPGSFALSGSIGNVTPLASLTANANIQTLTLASPVVNTSGDQVFNAPIILGASPTLISNNGAITFANSVNATSSGGQSLTLLASTGGSFITNTDVGLVTPLDAITTSGTLYMTNASITTLNNQTYNSGIDVTGTNTITSTNGGALYTHFGPSVLLSGTGSFIASSIGGSFYGDGNFVNNGSITITADTISIGIGSGVFTTNTGGSQTYNGSINTFAGGQSLTSTGGDITFNGTWNSAGAGILVSANNLYLNGNIGGSTVDYNNAFGGIFVTGNTFVGSAVTMMNVGGYGGSGGGPSFDGNFTIGSTNLTINGRSISFNGNVTSTVANTALTLNTNDFNGGKYYGGNITLPGTSSSLTTNTFNGGSFNTFGAGVTTVDVATQTYNASTFNFANSLTLKNTGGTVQVNMNSPITSSSNALTIAGNLSMGVPTSTSLGSLNVSGTTTLNGDASFASNVGNINFGAITGAYGLTINSIGSASLGSVNIGSLTATAASGITINGTNMITTGTQTFNGAMTLTTNSLFRSDSGDVIMSNTIDGGNNMLTINNAGINSSIAGIISNLSDLTMAGSGTLTLTADNDYTGTTHINSGTLQVGTGGATGLLGSGTVTNNGNLILNRNNTLTVTGIITGTGAVTTLGTGTTILANNNNYSGGTTISAGTLQIGNGGNTGAITGDIIDNGALVFNTSNNFTHSNVISGSGSVTQSGNGVITLNGNNTFDGALTINSGSLVITNANAMGSTLGSTTLNSGATLTIAGVTIGSEGLTLNGGTFGGSGIATFGGAISLNADTDISNNGGTFTLNSTFDNAHALTFSGAGTTILNGAIGTAGVGTELTSVTANTNLVVGGGAIKTSGNQSYQSVVTTNDTVFTSSGAGANSIAFNGNLSGGNNISLAGSNAGGSYTFTIGNITANNVDVSATAGATNNVFNLNTGGTQNFNATGSNAGTVTGVATVAGNFTYNNMQNINGSSGADNFILSGGSFGNINGGAGTNSLTADNVVNTWTITSANGGSVTGVSGSFVNIQNLIGGTTTDNFNFNPGATISGLVDGGDSIDRGNSINFNTYSTVLSLYLSAPVVPHVFEAGAVYHSSTRLANFVRVQQSIGNNIGYIILPNVPGIKVSRLPGDPNPLNGMIDDPFYYLGWIISTPSPVVPPAPKPISTPAPFVAPIVNQPNTNQNNNNNNSTNYVDPYGNTDTTDYSIINNTYTDPLLNTTTIKYGNTCTSYTP